MRSTYSIEKVLDTTSTLDPGSGILDLVRGTFVPGFRPRGPPPGPPGDIERTNLMYSGEPMSPIWEHPTTSESFVLLRGHFVCTVDGLPRYFSKSFHRRKLSENIVILFKVLDISHLVRPGARSFISRAAGCEIFYISDGRVRDL